MLLIFFIKRIIHVFWWMCSPPKSFSSSSLFTHWWFWWCWYSISGYSIPRTTQSIPQERLSQFQSSGYFMTDQYEDHKTITTESKNRCETCTGTSGCINSKEEGWPVWYPWYQKQCMFFMILINHCFFFLDWLTEWMQRSSTGVELVPGHFHREFPAMIPPHIEVQNKIPFQLVRGCSLLTGSV